MWYRWCGVVYHAMAWYGMVWYGMVWYGMVWYGMLWYGMLWYGMRNVTLPFVCHQIKFPVQLSHGDRLWVQDIRVNLFKWTTRRRHLPFEGRHCLF